MSVYRAGGSPAPNLPGLQQLFPASPSSLPEHETTISLPPSSDHASGQRHIPAAAVQHPAPPGPPAAGLGGLTSGRGRAGVGEKLRGHAGNTWVPELVPRRGSSDGPPAPAPAPDRWGSHRMGFHSALQTPGGSSGSPLPASPSVVQERNCLPPQTIKQGLPREAQRHLAPSQQLPTSSGGFHRTKLWLLLQHRGVRAQQGAGRVAAVPVTWPRVPARLAAGWLTKRFAGSAAAASCPWSDKQAA